MTKSRNPYLASLLSVPVPGLGQIYAGKGARGAAILSVTIIVGNLNAIWLSLCVLGGSPQKSSAVRRVIKRPSSGISCAG